MSKGKTIEDLHEELSPQDFARLMHQGKLRSGRTYQPADLEQLLDGLNTNLPRESVLESTPSSIDPNEVHVVVFYDPVANANYRTITVGGQAVVTLDQDGNLDLSNMHDTDKDLLKVIASAGMPGVEVRYQKKSRPNNELPGEKDKPEDQGSKKKEKKKKKRRPIRARAGNVDDPQFVEMVQKVKDALVYQSLSSPHKKRKVKIISGSELEQILSPEMFEMTQRKGYTVKAQHFNNFIDSQREKIRRYRKIYVSEHFHQPEIVEAYGEFNERFRVRPPGFAGQRKLTIIDTQNEERFQKIAESELPFQEAKMIYHWILDQKYDSEPHIIVGAFRYGILKLVEKAEDPIYDNIRDSSAVWLAYAKAADYVRQDRYLQEKILPLFEAQQKPAEANFEVLLQLVNRLTRPEEKNGLQLSNMMFEGLWMLDYLKNDKGVLRAGKGTETEFQIPTNYYLRGRSWIKSMLDKSFEQLLRKDEFIDYSNGEEYLTSALSCQEFGIKLFKQIDPDIRKEKFVRTNRKDDHGNKIPLDEKGTHLKWVLRLHTGMERSTYLDRIKEHYEK